MDCPKLPFPIPETHCNTCPWYQSRCIFSKEDQAWMRKRYSPKNIAHYAKNFKIY